MVRFAAAFAVALPVVLAVCVADAGIFRWTDAAGGSHYVDGLDNVPAAFRAVAVPVGLSNRPVVRAEPTSSPARESRISFVPGKHIVVDAIVNGSTPARLYLDTGASHTLLSPRVLRAAGVSLDHDGATLETRGVVAGVRTEMPRVTIDSLEIGRARLGRMLVSAYDMDVAGVDGLLGQDALGFFTVTIDAARGIVTIDPR